MSKKATQEKLILDELKRAGTLGLHPTEFITKLGILQYGRAINTIRKWFNCECKHGVHCMAEEHIINRNLSNGTTKFFYEKTPVDWEGMRQEVIQKRNEVEVQPQGSLF